jgi:hypothetical protein
VATKKIMPEQSKYFSFHGHRQKIMQFAEDENTKDVME